MSEESAFVVVFAGNSIDAGFVRSLLEGSGIETFLKDEAMGTMFPWYASPAGVGAVKVVVARENLDEARPIVEDFLDEQSRSVD